MRWTLSPEAPAPRTPVTRRALVLLSGAALAHVLLAWLTRIPALSWGEDDAGYILLAQQLRHFGYREVQDIVAPIHARFPPGYPLIIAALGWPFADATDALLALNVLFSVATIVLVYFAARRYLGEAIALLTAALFAINPMTVWDSAHVMAEAPFKFLMMLGVWALTREDEDSRFAVLAGGAILAAALTRSAGLFLLPALGLYWLVRRRYRWFGVFVLASLCTVGAWTAWTLVAPEPEQRRLYVSVVSRGAGRAPTNFIVDQLVRLPARARRLTTIVFPFVLAFPAVPRTPIDNLVSLGALVGLGSVGVIVMVRRWTAAALITLCYGTLLLAWRYAVERFANPLVPFVIAAMLVGIDWLTKRFAPRFRGWGLAGMALLLSIGAAQLNGARLASALDCDRDDPVNSSCWDATYRDYLKAAHWVRDSTPTSAVFFVNKERGFYLHSGRLTINQDRALQEDSLSLAGYLRSSGAQYTVATSVGLRAAQHDRLLASACRDFVLLRRFPSNTLVLRLRAPDDSAADDGACRALETYRNATRSSE
jgi:hypothetical protein